MSSDADEVSASIGRSLGAMLSEILSTGKTGLIAGSDHHIEWVSDVGRLLLGASVDSDPHITGSDWFALTPPELRLADDRAFSQAQRSGSSDWFVKTFQLPGDDGQSTLIEVESMLVKRTASPFRWLALLRVPSADTEGSSLTGNVRTRALATMQLARRLSACTTSQQILRVVDRLAAPAMAVDTVSVTIFEANGETVTHRDPTFDEHHFTDIDGGFGATTTAVGAAAEMKRTVIVSDVEVLSGHYPVTIKRMAAASLVAYAAVPMLREDGSLFGVLHCGWRHRSWIDVAHLEAISEVISNAMITVRTVEYQRKLTGTLQEMMLPLPAPAIEGCTVATRYQPFETMLGGDFYDVVERGQQVWFIVGDVTGHGLLAARTMGKVRFFLRALLMNVQRPSQLLRAASELLVAEHSDELATCAVVLWNRAAGTLQVATAGNLAPLVADHRGVRFVELTPLPPLGVVRHDTPDEVDVLVALTSPAQLLMFTDGLVERRDDVIDDSLEELRQLIEAAGGTAQQVVENVLAPLLSTASDDVAVLCADLRPGGHAD